MKCFEIGKTVVAVRGFPRGWKGDIVEIEPMTDKLPDHIAGKDDFWVTARWHDTGSLGKMPASHFELEESNV